MEKVGGGWGGERARCQIQVIMKLDIVNREDACICTYTLDFELFDLILNKWEGGREGDSELGSGSDAAMHLPRPVLGTFCLCSSGLMYHTNSSVQWTHISGLTLPSSTQLVSITIVCSWCSHTILQNCSNDSGSGPSGGGKEGEAEEKIQIYILHNWSCFLTHSSGLTLRGNISVPFFTISLWQTHADIKCPSIFACNSHQ